MARRRRVWPDLGICPARRLTGRLAVCLVICLVPLAGGRAQEIQLGGDLSSATPRKQHVELETEGVQVKAGQREWVELRFRVEPGLHINSHAPHDELLVPTALGVDAAGPLKVVEQAYPPGLPLHLEVGGGETLSTYQGEFRVRLELLAQKGAAMLTGTLRYQACNDRACFPPRSLPVRVAVTAQ